MPFTRDFPPDGGPYVVKTFRDNYNDLDDRAKGLPTNYSAYADYAVKVRSDGSGLEVVQDLYSMVNNETAKNENSTITDQEALHRISGLTIYNTTIKIVHSTDPTQPVTVTVSDNVSVRSQFRLFIPSNQTGTVTIQRETNGTIQGGRSSDGNTQVVVVPDNRDRYVLLEVVATGPTITAVGDILFDQRTFTGGNHEFKNTLLCDVLGNHKRETQTFSTAQTFGSEARGKRLVFTGTSATTWQFDTTSGNFDEGSECIVINDGSADLTLQKSGGTATVTVPAKSGGVAKARVIQVINNILRYGDEINYGELT